MIKEKGISHLKTSYHYCGSKPHSIILIYNIREVISGPHCDHSVLDCEDKTYTILFKDSRRIKLKVGSIFSSICVISHVSSCRILAESERRDVRIKIDIRGFTVKATWLPSLKEMRTCNIPSTKQRMWKLITNDLLIETANEAIVIQLTQETTEATHYNKELDETCSKTLWSRTYSERTEEWSLPSDDLYRRFERIEDLPHTRRLSHYQHDWGVGRAFVEMINKGWVWEDFFSFLCISSMNDLQEIGNTQRNGNHSHSALLSWFQRNQIASSASQQSKRSLEHHHLSYLHSESSFAH